MLVVNILKQLHHIQLYIVHSPEYASNYTYNRLQLVIAYCSGVVEDLLRVQNELTDLKDDYGVVADERNRFLDKYSELQG